MTLDQEYISKGNKKQLEKFCPLIKARCRFDCNFFERAHWKSGQDCLQGVTFLIDAVCTYRDK